MKKKINKTINKFIQKIVFIIYISITFIILITGIVISIKTHGSKTNIVISSNIKMWIYKYTPDFKLSQKFLNKFNAINIKLPIKSKLFEEKYKLKNQKFIVVLNFNVDISSLFKESKQNLGLHLGKLSDATEVYVNKIKIGEIGKSGKNIFSAFNFEQCYKIPEVLIKGSNIEITIVIYVSTVPTIIKPFIIGNFNTLKFDAELKNFFNVYLKQFLVIFLLIIFFTFLFISYIEKRKDLLYLSLLSLFISFFSFNQILKFIPIQYHIFNYFFTYKSIYISSILITLYLTNFTDTKLNFIMKLQIIVAIISLLIDSLYPNNFFIRRAFYKYILFIFLLYFYYLIFYFLTKSKKIRNGKKLILPLIALLLSITNDILVFAFPDSYPQMYLLLYGFQFLIIVSAINIMIDLIMNYKNLIKKIKRLKEVNTIINKRINDINSIFSIIKNNILNLDVISEKLKDLGADSGSMITQFSSTIEQISSNAELISTNENEIANTSKDELKIIENLKIDLSEIYLNFNKMYKNINIVKDLATSINDLAKQTSLLSLNASIEAARNSSILKGFTIVSNEIKNLSEKTRNIAYEIDKIIINIINSVETTHENLSGLTELFEMFYSHLSDFTDLINSNFIKIRNLSVEFEKLSDAVEKLSEISQEFINLSDSIYEETSSIKKIIFR